MKRTILFVVLLAFLVVGGLSQEEAEEPRYDYTDDTNYQNPDFYQNSDPSRWDWSQIDWEKMDFERADLYALPKFYQNLPAERYSSLNYRLVTDFDLITDHSLIDGTKFVWDFGCTECAFDAGEEGTQLQYNEEGQITHLRSGDNIYSGDFPAGSSFQVSDDGLIVECPPRATSLCTSDRGMFTIITRNDGEVLPRTLDYQGHAVGGSLSFREGQLYVKFRDRASINLVSIYNVRGTSAIDIYFDGLAHTGRYASFGENTLIIHSEIGQGELGYPLDTYEFSSGNPYLDVPPESEFLFDPGVSSTLIIQDRSERNLVPLVTIIVPSNDRASFTNGGTTIQLDSERVNVRTSSAEGRSAPLALVPLSEDERNLLEPGTIMLFDEQNNALVVNEGVADEVFARERALCSDCPVSQIMATIEESEVLYDYYHAQILDALPASSSFASFTDDPQVLAQILEGLRRVPPELLESVTVIKVLTPENREFVCGQLADGCFFPGGIVISTVSSLGAGAPLNIPGTLSHEIAHAWAAAIWGREREIRDEEVARRVEEILATYGSAENTPPAELEALSILLGELGQNPFRTRWEANAGEIYGQNLVDPLTHSFWSGTVDVEPRYGCFRAYGCYNFNEDVATSAQQFYENPELVRALINPESGFYGLRIGREIGNTGETMTPEIAENWARRYRERVELLYEYGFITEEDYQQVVGEQE